MKCEICGQDAKSPQIILLEGAELAVCQRCSGHGTFVRMQQAPRGFTRRKRGTRPITVLDVVADYDKLVREGRAKLGLKQEEIAKKINEPESLISRIESGKVAPSEKVARKLEKLFKIKLLEEAKQVAFEEKREPMRATTLGDIVKIRKRKG